MMCIFSKQDFPEFVYFFFEGHKIYVSFINFQVSRFYYLPIDIRFTKIYIITICTCLMMMAMSNISQNLTILWNVSKNKRCKKTKMYLLKWKIAKNKNMLLFIIKIRREACFYFLHFFIFKGTSWFFLHRNLHLKYSITTTKCHISVTVSPICNPKTVLKMVWKFNRGLFYTLLANSEIFEKNYIGHNA